MEVHGRKGDTEDTGYITRIWDIQQKDDSVGKGIHNRFIYILVSLIQEIQGCKSARIQVIKGDIEEIRSIRYAGTEYTKDTENTGENEITLYRGQKTGKLNVIFSYILV